MHLFLSPPVTPSLEKNDSEWRVPSCIIGVGSRPLLLDDARVRTARLQGIPRARECHRGTPQNTLKSLLCEYSSLHKGGFELRLASMVKGPYGNVL